MTRRLMRRVMRQVTRALLLTAAMAVVVSASIPPALADAQQRDGQRPLQSGTGRIIGAVMTAGDNPTPVRRAVVSARAAGPATISQITDDAGRFVFEGLPPGDYQITATRPPFVPAEYGARRPGRPGTRLSLGQGQTIDDVTLEMARGATISGFVRMGNGAPAAGVTMMVVPRGTDIGIFAIRGARLKTDDRGAYRAFGLVPGEYIVAAVPDSNIMQEVQAPTGTQVDALLAELQRGPGLAGAPPPSVAGSAPGAPALSPAPPIKSYVYAPVFHPGTTVQDRATSIRVAAGDDRNGIDVQIEMMPTATVSGAVFWPGGSAGSGLQMIISGADAARPSSWSAPILSERPGDDGRFRYTNVTPGHYRVTARVVGDDPQFAIAEFDMTGDDITGLSLALRPALTASAILRFDGTSDPPSDVSGLRAQLLPPTGGGSLVVNGTNYGLRMQAAGQFGPDGRALIPGVLPGDYTPLVVDNGNVIPAGWWLRSVIVNGVDTLDAPLVVDSTDVHDMVFTYTDRHSAVGGRITGAAGQAASGYDVVIFSADRAHWTTGARRTQHTRPSSDGRYAFADLPAGDYLLAVLDDLEPTDLDDPAFLEQVASAAVRITVADGASVTQDLRIGSS
jgi:uncharacterized protein (DUF2141 family)